MLGPAGRKRPFGVMQRRACQRVGGALPHPGGQQCVWLSVRMHLPADMAIVGRDREQAELATALRSTRAGYGRAVLLPGEAGMGKSMLADWLVSKAEQAGMRVARGARCAAGRPPRGRAAVRWPRSAWSCRGGRSAWLPAHRTGSSWPPHPRCAQHHRRAGRRPRPAPARHDPHGPAVQLPAGRSRQLADLTMPARN